MNEQMTNGQTNEEQTTGQTGYEQTGYYDQTTYDQAVYGQEATAQVTSPIIETRSRGFGILGAALGALAGGAIWAIVGCLGYIYSIIGCLIFYLAYWGYRKFYGKDDALGLIVSTIFSFLVIAPASYISYAYIVMESLNEYASNPFGFFEVLGDMPLYFERFELWPEFWENLVMGYVYLVIGCALALYSEIARKRREAKEAKNKQ